MKKILLTIAVLFLFLTMGLCLGSFAQETDQPVATEEVQPAQEEEMEAPLAEDDQLFGFGQVAQISKEAMTLTEYDFETDEEMQINYVIDAETKLDNIASLDEIKIDDEVGVNYEEKDDQKLARTIFKYIEMEETQEEFEDVLEEDVEDVGENIVPEQPVAE